MFSKIRRMLGNIKVVQTEREIVISGLPADVIQNDISKIWKTSRINAHMFSKVSKDSLAFPLFFATDVYYILDTMTQDRNRRTNIRTVRKLMALLLSETWLQDTVLEPQPRVDLSKIKNLVYTPKDYQQKFLETYDQLTQQYHLSGYLLSAAAGSGKAQPLNASIKTPSGWVLMGDVQVGDMVTARDGEPSEVTDVYPQGKKSVFNVHFKDGRSTRASAEHLWKVYDRACYRNANDGWSVVTTVKLMELLSKKNSMIYVPLNLSDDGTDLDLPIEPYLLGAILGDGSISQTGVSITKGDTALFDLLTPYLPEGMVFVQRNDITRGIINSDKAGKRNPLVTNLKTLNLMGTVSQSKFIPADYLNGSKRQRLDLLQGLMDTDGYIDVQGTANYSTSSYMLATHVTYLVRSLGGIARISSKLPTYTYLGEKLTGSTAYRVNIRYTKPTELFKLPRKKERANDEGQYSKGLKLQVVGVTYAGMDECQCISIAHPERLYITDDFIVTHNTYQTLVLAECLQSDLIVIVCPKNAVDRVWRTEVQTLFKKPPTLWVYKDGKPYKGERVVVLHYEALKHVVAMAGKFKAKTPVIVLDESHNLNEAGSGRTQYFIELCRALKSRDVVWASGTPIKAMGGEAIPLLTTIDPFFTEDVMGRFKRIYGRDGNRGVDILRHRIGLMSYKVEKSQLGLDKPILKKLPVLIPNGNDYTLGSIRKDMQAFITERFAYYKSRSAEDTRFYKECMALHKTTVKGRLHDASLAIYTEDVKVIQKSNGDARVCAEEIKRSNDYEKRFVLPSLPPEYRKRFKDVKSIIKYVNLKIQGEALGRILGRKRIQCHVDMVPYIDFKGVCNSTSKKTVVFTSFVDALEATHKHLSGQGMSPVAVYGKTNNELANTVKLFEQQEDLNPLVATYQSLSTAVPLVMADTMLMINSPFRAYIHEQAISRIHRLGADTQTVVWEAYLDTGEEPNISTRSGDILEWSQKQVELIMGIKSPFEIDASDSGLTISSEAHELTEAYTLPKHIAPQVAPNYLMDW